MFPVLFVDTMVIYRIRKNIYNTMQCKKCKRGEAVIWISKSSLSAMYPRIC